MFKNKLLIVLFCICMIAIMSTSASAYPLSALGGWVWTPTNSIECNGLYRGCASNEDTRSSWIRVTVNLEPNPDGDPNALVTLLNPGGNPGGEGVAVPFSAIGTTSNTGETEPESIVGKGTCTSDITIGNDQLQNLLRYLLDEYLKNNWSVQYIDILYFGGGVEIYADVSDYCETHESIQSGPDCIENPLEEGGYGYWERVIHAYFKTCELRYDEYGDPESYDCSEPEVWEWSKKKPLSNIVFPWDID